LQKWDLLCQGIDLRAHPQHLHEPGFMATQSHTMTTPRTELVSKDNIRTLTSTHLCKSPMCRFRSLSTGECMRPCACCWHLAPSGICFQDNPRHLESDTWHSSEHCQLTPKKKKHLAETTAQAATPVGAAWLEHSIWTTPAA
jgi:hypothetical protein